MKFLRADTNRYSRLGRGRKKLQKWRRPRGKHNKLRLKRFSYPLQPGIGFGTPRKESGKIRGLTPFLVKEPSDIARLTKNNIVIISRRIGAKKKLDILKKLSELNIKVANEGAKK